MNMENKGMSVFLCTDTTVRLLILITSHKKTKRLLFLSFFLFAVITVTWPFGCTLKYKLLMTQTAQRKAQACVWTVEGRRVMVATPSGCWCRLTAVENGEMILHKLCCSLKFGYLSKGGQGTSGSRDVKDGICLYISFAFYFPYSL